MQEGRLKITTGGAGKSSVDKLPSIVSLNIKTADDNQKPKAFGLGSKAPLGKGRKDSKSTSNLFNTGLKSTGMVIDTVQESVYKPARQAYQGPGGKKDGEETKKASAEAIAKAELMKEAAKKRR